MNSDELREWQLRLGFDPDELSQLQPQPTRARAPRASRGKPPLIRCRCGRLHRSWNEHKVCNRCVSESRRSSEDELHERVTRLELERVERQRSPELAAERAATFERWLARQPADHPWRQAPATVEPRSRVAAGGGGA